MKLLCIIGVSLGLALLAGCDPVAQPPQPTVYGKWLSDQQQSVLQLNEDGTFLISRRSETPDEMRGKFTLGDDDQRIVMTAADDSSHCPQVMGTYVYDLEGKRLFFTKVIDDCTWRENELIYPWIRLGGSSGSDPSADN